MAMSKSGQFALGCFAAFVSAAVVTCVTYAAFHGIPQAKSNGELIRLNQLIQYSYLQYSQANPAEGRAALSEYANFLENMEREHIKKTAPLVHDCLGAAYLRLSRLDKIAGNATMAAQEMAAAQREFSQAQRKNFDTSQEALNTWLAGNDAHLAKMYAGATVADSAAVPVPAKQTAPPAAAK